MTEAKGWEFEVEYGRKLEAELQRAQNIQVGRQGVSGGAGPSMMDDWLGAMAVADGGVVVVVAMSGPCDRGAVQEAAARGSAQDADRRGRQVQGAARGDPGGYDRQRERGAGLVTDAWWSSVFSVRVCAVAEEAPGAGAAVAAAVAASAGRGARGDAAAGQGGRRDPGGDTTAHHRPSPW